MGDEPRGEAELLSRTDIVPRVDDSSSRAYALPQLPVRSPLPAIWPAASFSLPFSARQPETAAQKRACSVSVLRVRPSLSVDDVYGSPHVDRLLSPCVDRLLSPYVDRLLLLRSRVMRPPAADPPPPEPCTPLDVMRTQRRMMQDCFRTPAVAHRVVREVDEQGIWRMRRLWVQGTDVVHAFARARGGKGHGGWRSHTPWPPNLDLSKQLMQSPARSGIRTAELHSEKAGAASTCSRVCVKRFGGKGGKGLVRVRCSYRSRWPGTPCKRRRTSIASAWNHTRTWREGEKVKGENASARTAPLVPTLPAGTA